MKTQILLNVDYSGNEKFWSESQIKNKIFTIEKDKNIHNQIAEILEEEDFCELSYKNKPQSNIYIDTKNGDTKKVGYVYRGKQHIYDRSANINGVKANFDVWVTIKEVTNFEIEEVNY